MTNPTTQDTELDEILTDYASKYFQLLRTNAPRELEERHREIAKAAITKEKERAAVEARIDEIKRYCEPSIYQAAKQLHMQVPNSWTVASELGLTPMMADDRLATLEAKRKELSDD